MFDNSAPTQYVLISEIQMYMNVASIDALSIKETFLCVSHESKLAACTSISVWCPQECYFESGQCPH